MHLNTLYVLHYSASALFVKLFHQNFPMTGFHKPDFLPLKIGRNNLLPTGTFYISSDVYYNYITNVFEKGPRKWTLCQCHKTFTPPPPPLVRVAISCDIVVTRMATPHGGHWRHPGQDTWGLITLASRMSFVASGAQLLLQ